MAWLPAAKLEVVRPAVVVFPVVLTFTGLPALVPSITNWTAPVGVPIPGVETLMVAVKVTAWPDIDGLAEELTAVLVLALPTACVRAVEALAAKLPSPL
jgi:hypothetical protein